MLRCLVLLPAFAASIAGADPAGLVSAARSASDYLPGDLVTWMLPGNLPHIGIVSDRRSASSGRPLILHNIGAGPAEEDLLFNYPITGHYRFRVR